MKDAGGDSFTLDELSHYADGTLGKAFYHFLKQHDFKADDYAMHDIIHVLTGLEPTPAGEEIAMVYDYTLRNTSKEMDPDQFMRVKMEVANIRASIPAIARENNRPLGPYHVACEDELRAHFIIADSLRDRIKEQFGKPYHALDFHELFAMDAAFFDEVKEIITGTRNNPKYKECRIQIIPPEDPDAMLTAAPHFIVQQRTEDLDGFNGVPYLKRFFKWRSAQKEVPSSTELPKF